VICQGDDSHMVSQFRIERLRAQVPGEAPAAITQDVALPPPALEAPEAEEDDEVTVAEDEDDETEAANDTAQAAAGETPEEAERRRRRRRRRRRGGRRDETLALHGQETAASDGAAAGPADEAAMAETHIEGVPEHIDGDDEEHRGAAGQTAGNRPRRGRRGGRRRRHDGEGEMPPHAAPGADQPELPPVYTGPTPANPFGGNTFDIFDVMEQAEVAAPTPSPVQPTPVPGLEPENAPVLAEPEPPVLEEPPAETDEPVNEPVAASQAEPAAPTPAPEPEPLVAANDALAEPAVKPIIIGAGDAPAAEKKRGWWRR
jgi:ribonuclease E